MAQYLCCLLSTLWLLIIISCILNMYMHPYNLILSQWNHSRGISWLSSTAKLAHYKRKYHLTNVSKLNKYNILKALLDTNVCVYKVHKGFYIIIYIFTTLSKKTKYVIYTRTVMLDFVTVRLRCYLMVTYFNWLNLA